MSTGNIFLQVHASSIHLLDLVGAHLSDKAKAAKVKNPIQKDARGQMAEHPHNHWPHQEDRTLKAMLRVVDALADDPEYKFRILAEKKSAISIYSQISRRNLYLSTA